jgi:acetylornithine deacetylase/succinyl-diaminopimelate desuccinylase-like protein
MPGAAGRPLVANAHIDTVADGDGWIRNPYGELVGDRLYGLGTCDAKGSLVAALLAATVLLRLGEEPTAPLEIHSVIDEEPGGNGTLALLDHLGAQRPPRLAVIMEPTRLDLLSGHRGMLWYGLRCVGRQAHGSTGAGINAIERAADVVAALRDLNTELTTWPAGDYDSPRLNVGVISGGHEVYTTPGTCQLELSARYAPGQRERVDDAIRQALHAAVPAGAVETMFHRDFDAAETSVDDPVLAAAATVLREHRPDSRIGRLGGTCDMRHYRNMLGVPSMIFGPGDLVTAHGPGEFVDLPEVQLAAEVLVELAMRPWDVTEARED